MVRTNQGGSVLGFVIIGGVLALLLIGGVYFVRQQSEVTPSRGISPTPTENQPREEQSTPNEETPPSNNENKSTEENKNNSQPQTETLPGGGTNTGTTELPQTGPAESFISVLLLAVVAGLGVSYVRSRRVLRSL